MQYFNFRRLIEKYISEFKVITFTESQLKDNGDWVKGEKNEIVLKGAVIGRGENTILRSDGKLTAKDRRLFMLEPIQKALLGSKIVYENDTYTVENSTDNAKFTGVYAYNLKYVSAFKDGEG